MLIIVGFLVVIISVVGGYVLSHGKLGALWQPYELLIIGGAALGAFLVSTPGKIVKATFVDIAGVFKGPRYKSDDYRATLTLIYELLNKARRDGFLALEDHVE
jgi:chemotaxis protein MotA